MTLPMIARFATPEEIESNPLYSGLDPHTGILFCGKPMGRGGKYSFMHQGVQIVVFRAIQARYTGEYLGRANGQVVINRYLIEEKIMYKIMPGQKPFYLEKGKMVLPSGKIQVFGIWYMPQSNLLTCF